MTQQKVILSPRIICETKSGDLAHTVGRLAFYKGRPMLVEHIGGLFLAHNFKGEVLTPGYGSDYDIVLTMHEDEACQRFRNFTSVQEA